MQRVSISLLEAKEKTGIPIVTEVMDISQLPLFENVDVIQVGARNMQNFELLKKVGKLDKPILLKRGLANTLQELLMSAEYIMAGGNEKVILCERGIRTFETATRNTLDLSAIPLLKTMTHLPIVVDPSHATGIASMVKPMAMAATAAGADGLMIEVHNNPSAALCDGAQSLTPEAFADVMKSVELIRPLAYKALSQKPTASLYNRRKTMEIGIIGLGLIGGSLAKAISQNTDNTVYGYDISDQVVKKGRPRERHRAAA